MILQSMKLSYILNKSVVNRIKASIKLFTELTKVTITLPVTFLTFSGYALAHHIIDTTVIWVCLGVFMLAGAASIINQIIEYRFDKIMERTRKRPIPSGRISSMNAAWIAIVMTVIGVALLWPESKAAVLLGIINLVWYLGIYTYLKRFTALAVVPGSITGAIPLLIGWAAGNGQILNPEILYLSFFVFMWQIPHFWLLMLIYGKDYESAGYPTLFRVFSDSQVRIWTLAWIIALTLVPLSFLIFGLINSLTYSFVVAISSVSIIIIATRLLIYKPEIKNNKMMFHLINLFMVGILIIKMFDSFQK